MDEIQFKLMRLIDANPEMSQREAARELGVSLGKINYCLRALIQKGWVKVGNFQRAQTKVAYTYILTPCGLREKARLALHFLQIKMREYERLREEVNDM